MIGRWSFGTSRTRQPDRSPLAASTPRPSGANGTFTTGLLGLSFKNAGSSFGTTVKAASSASAGDTSQTTTSSGTGTPILVSAASARPTTALMGGSGQTTVAKLSGTNNYGAVSTQAGGASVSSFFSMTTADQLAMISFQVLGS